MSQLTNEHIAKELLQKILGPIDDKTWDLLLQLTEVQHYNTGDFIFYQDDPGDAFYLVITGRFRALQNTSEGIYILGDISVGEPIGEIALFTKENRMASVVALRKSTVLKLNEAAYFKLIQAFPQFAAQLTKYIVERIRRNAAQRKKEAAPKNIAVVKLQQESDVSAFTGPIIEELQRMGFMSNVYYHNTQEESQYNQIFEEMENREGLNFLVCDANHLNWANQCIAYCDLIIVATDFNAETTLTEIEEKLHLYTNNVLNKKLYLLLLHAPNVGIPENTRKWFSERSFSLHLHMRMLNDRDTRRFCRVITHQAIGLVLGGGGVKGFAHIGAVKALLEKGIEIDFVGGTSAGANYGAGMAKLEFNLEAVMQACNRAVALKPTSNDYHIPIVSLMSGKKMRKFLEELFQDYYLEDLWIPTFCTSTNFSNAVLAIHDKGMIRKKVEASIAIPGVFPPAIIENELHIDGGVLDNLPIESMLQRPVKHVFAIALSGEESNPIELQEVPNSWQLFKNSLRKTNFFKIPGLASILVNSITINSRQKQELTKSYVSHFLELNLKQYKFLDWSKWKDLVNTGYEQTRDFLEQNPPENKFWE